MPTLAAPSLQFMVQEDRFAGQAGGLSGQCLTDLAQQAMQRWSRCVGDRCVLVGVGGIANGAQAKARLDAGAKLLQLYTALVYQGPGCVPHILNTLSGDLG